MQLISIAKEIWTKKYKAPQDTTIDDMFSRVSGHIAQYESSRIEGLFYGVLSEFKFFPGGRISNDAGVNNYLNNCFCIFLHDSIESIYDAVKKVAVISKNGGGVGFNIDELRPKDSPLSGGGTASGAVSWLNIFDTSCSVIKTAGNRRAALIAVMSIWHPDIYDYIDAKREEGKLQNFNISVAVNDKFMHCVANDLDWDLVWGGKVYRTVKARDLWEKLAYSGWKYNDPGILWEDTINNNNDMSYLYALKSVNPCGELSLPADEVYGEGSCCLGNVNTTRFVKSPFATHGFAWKDNFDFEEYARTIAIAVRFLDDVLDTSKYPYESNKRIAESDRRIGLNHISGIGSTLALLKIPYDSELATDVVETLSRIARDTAYAASIELAKEKGPFPNFDVEKYTKGGFFQTLPLAIQHDICQFGIRNCAIGTVPPAGTGSILMNNISNGIEPFFMVEYNRNIRQPDGSNVVEPVEDFAWGIYKRMGKPDGEKPDYFRSAREVSPESHLKLQSVVQKYIAGNISKTVNLPETCTLEDYKIYMELSWKLKNRGFTTFREGTREGVLVAKDEKKTPAALVEQAKILPSRPYVISGQTYQLRDDTDKRTYCTINHIDDNGTKKPWEIFLFSKSAHGEWYAAIGVLLSAIMRKIGNNDFLLDLLEDLKEVDGDNGYFTKEHGFMKSKVQHIASILEAHVKELNGLTNDDIFSKCPDCGEMKLVKEGGCNHCIACDYSTCG
jgi:ribonucleoside-diphosphate reductase alpha chain